MEHPRYPLSNSIGDILNIVTVAKNFRWGIGTLGLTEVVKNGKEQDCRAKQPVYSFDYSSSFALIRLIIEYNFADYMNLKKLLGFPCQTHF